MFRKPTILVIAASLTLLGASAASAAPLQGSPGAPGIGDPYFPLDGNGGYDVAGYDLDLKYDPGPTGSAASPW